MDIPKELRNLKSNGYISVSEMQMLRNYHTALTHSRDELLDAIYARLAMDIEYNTNYPEDEDIDKNVPARLEALQAEFEKLR